MVDEIDIIQRNSEMENEAHVRAALREASKIPAGEPGECVECGWDSPRLVRGRCAPCRDGRS